MKKSLILASTATILALSGCATPFSARVSRFQQLPPPSGQTFVVESKDPGMQGSLEFQHYADLVTAQMEKVGYRPASDPASAQFVVDMHYMVDHGRERVVTTPDPWGGRWGPWGPWGYRGWGWGWGWGDPFMYGPGFGPDVHSYTVYTSELDLDIERTSDGKQVFDGHAQAHSTTNALTTLVPDLIDAMFTNFPGNNGETVKITVQPEKR